MVFIVQAAEEEELLHLVMATRLPDTTHIPELLLVIWRFVHINDISLIFVAVRCHPQATHLSLHRHALLIPSITS